jgi:hypothetical protein
MGIKVAEAEVAEPFRCRRPFQEEEEEEELFLDPSHAEEAG